MRAETNSPVTRPPVVAPKKPDHERRSLLPEVDGRSLLARGFRDIQNAIVADQGRIGRFSPKPTSRRLRKS
jgi:hypothetical protein